jgi:IMP dehydrogenase
MKKMLSFDDVLILPNFSTISSRKDVDTKVNLNGLKLDKGIISSNMDTVTGSDMARAMIRAGGNGALHRFCSIEENIIHFKNSDPGTIVSFGIGDGELDRAKALTDAGADYFLLDVAHGASMNVVEAVKKFRLFNKNSHLIVGNFATGKSVEHFLEEFDGYEFDAIKVGVGGGSMCLTRVVTGAGAPTFASVLDCVNVGLPIIADGGIRNSGDYAKAIAAGADAIMIGKLLSSCKETPGPVIYTEPNDKKGIFPMKQYRGSASKESYEVQGKVSEWRTPEGDSTMVLVTEHAHEVVQRLDAGLRSSMSYVGAFDIKEFKNLVEFVEVTSNGTKENGAHGK